MDTKKPGTDTKHAAKEHSSKDYKVPVYFDKPLYNSLVKRSKEKELSLSSFVRMLVSEKLNYHP